MVWINDDFTWSYAQDMKNNCYKGAASKVSLCGINDVWRVWSDRQLEAPPLFMNLALGQDWASNNIFGVIRSEPLQKHLSDPLASFQFNIVANTAENLGIHESSIEVISVKKTTVLHQPAQTITFHVTEGNVLMDVATTGWVLNDQLYSFSTTTSTLGHRETLMDVHMQSLPLIKAIE